MFASALFGGFGFAKLRRRRLANDEGNSSGTPLAA
jgi:hypothetical protein